MSKAWSKTGYLKATPAKVDQKQGVIRGVKICSQGEAAGHGVHLDEEFIDTLVQQGNASKRGLKARFGHPSMCSQALGTFIGRFKNFSRGATKRNDGTDAACCFGDLHLSESAKETPNGDLHAYVLAMAENEADMFGTSIVFTQGQRYRRDQHGKKLYPRNQDGSWSDAYDQAGKAGSPDFVECKTLHACDCVDDPAANDGLFSAFAGETVAGQISEFLDQHPQVFELLEQSPEVMEAITRYGDRFDEFFSRYQQYRNQDISNPPPATSTDKEAEMADENKGTTPEATETETAASAEQTSAPETTVAASTDAHTPNVDEAITAALAADRKRAAEIDELGEKFGFGTDAKKFKADGKSVDEFRTHILNKSPEDWRASLAIKNPATQAAEQELSDSSEGTAAVNRIKEKRQARYSS